MRRLKVRLSKQRKRTEWLADCRCVFVCIFSSSFFCCHRVFFVTAGNFSFLFVYSEKMSTIQLVYRIMLAYRLAIRAMHCKCWQKALRQTINESNKAAYKKRMNSQEKRKKINGITTTTTLKRNERTLKKEMRIEEKNDKLTPKDISAIIYFAQINNLHLISLCLFGVAYANDRFGLLAFVWYSMA